MSDYISRADAIEAVASADETNGTVKVFSGFEVIDILKALPSTDAVEVVRDTERVAVRREEYEDLIADAVQGEWLYVENEPYSECSKCGRYIDDLDEDKYAYCPYCGARMKGGAE